MRFSLLLALGAGQVALAAYSNETTTSRGRGPQPTQTPPPGGARLPPQVGDFQLYGCTGSEAGFPTFSKIASTPDMTLDFCAASCPTRFFGAYDTDCYCGEEVDPATSRRVAPELCDVPCPGDTSEFCGGRAGLGMARRQSVPLTIVLSLYVRTRDGGNPGMPTITTPPATITKTITRTTTGTITSCPPYVHNCPVGSKTTDVVTITTEICPIQEWHKKKIICYGDYCAPEHPCEKCERHRIVCDGDECRPEVCHEKDDWNKLVFCKGDKCHFPQCKDGECNRKIVCFDGKCAHEKCWGKECEKKFVCHGDECKFEKCDGDECHKKIICDDKECKPEPACKDSCPSPPPYRPGHDDKDRDQNEASGKIVPPTPQQSSRPSGSKPPGSKDSPPVVVAGSDRTTVAFDLLGAAVGLILLL